jgi:hypothetical protein
LKLKNFSNTKTLKKEVKKKSFICACESCFAINPDIEEGYTTCCNECCAPSQTIIKLAKQEDILNFLRSKFNNVSSSGNLSYSDKVVFTIPNKNKQFNLYMNASEESLIEQIALEIKGLRKEGKHG